MDIELAVQDLAPRLLCYCLSKTNDPGLAEEIAQESLAALVQRWQRHGPPDSAQAFVFATARRRAGRANLRQRLWTPLENLLGRRSDGLDPEARAIEHSEQKRLRGAVSKLAYHDREALLLVAIGEVSIEEAAGLLGISVSAVKMRVLRARRRLVTLLEKENEGRP